MKITKKTKKFFSVTLQFHMVGVHIENQWGNRKTKFNGETVLIYVDPLYLANTPL